MPFSDEKGGIRIANDGKREKQNYIAQLNQCDKTSIFYNCALLNNESHLLHTFAVFGAGGNDINACCVDTTVT